MTFADQRSYSSEEQPISQEDVERESPRHGFRGHRSAAEEAMPLSLTVAVSREAGSRGNSIGTRVGVKLGWPVYNHELLQYLAQEGVARQNLIETLPARTTTWVE